METSEYIMIAILVLIFLFEVLMVWYLYWNFNNINNNYNNLNNMVTEIYNSVVDDSKPCDKDPCHNVTKKYKNKNKPTQSN